MVYAYMARVVHLLVSEVHDVIYGWNENWGNHLVGWWSQWICHDVTTDIQPAIDLQRQNDAPKELPLSDICLLSNSK